MNGGRKGRRQLYPTIGAPNVGRRSVGRWFRGQSTHRASAMGEVGIVNDSRVLSTNTVVVEVTGMATPKKAGKYRVWLDGRQGEGERRTEQALASSSGRIVEAI